VCNSRAGERRGHCLLWHCLLWVVLRGSFVVLFAAEYIGMGNAGIGHWIVLELDIVGTTMIAV